MITSRPKTRRDSQDSCDSLRAGNMGGVVSLPRRGLPTVSLLALILLLSGLTACSGSGPEVSSTPPTAARPAASGTARAERLVAIQQQLGVDMHYSLSALSS